ncbi:hypothetical protein FSP39_004729 [Pinctada imbricata]|uniref:Fibronectin type-III domain-containing protein n=1 Tax=Pinctada imbricata TaxID=66713 RepID=A0AA89BYG4_PINIB|nr:hypothetical protein FSP39_004729 [Pinctada imbricata]
MATCNWQEEDYFSMLMHADKKSHVALEMLVDDLHADKERTIHKFLGHSGAEDFLWGLVKLLGSDIPRVAGNSAYIIGTIAETEMGCHRILGLAKGEHSERRKILPDLTRMLTFDDAESVMNAAGTMGTLAEGYEGREWILEEPCLPETLEHVTALLQAENLWTASNAALVLARLSISENGCNRILEHENSQHILSRLVQSLGVDEAGRGMNAAFAIGRLCDIEIGRKRLLSLPDSERMLSALAKMLCCDDTGASKNACFALSCLATNVEGHTRLLNNIHSDDILRTLSSLLNASDSETGWFAAMTLRTLASQPRGCLRLREHPQVVPSLKAVDKKSDANPDLKEEVGITLEILKKLEKPLPPVVEVIGSDRILAKWEAVSTKSGFQVRYQLFDLTKCVYTGKDTSCEVGNLLPCSQYTYKIRAYTEGDESPFSDTVTIVTEESVPSPPQNLRVLGCTITQLKIGWDPPDQVNGALKGYYVFQGEKLIEHTSELTAIITGLTASTSYEIEVCAATVKGKGEKACVIGTTSDIGAHAPSKPHVQVLGRNELHITWDSPEVPLGRITRYDLLMNGKIIYSGTDLSYTVRRLTPDTEYSFVVLALTSEGKFDSKVTKKKTAKDEYDSSRPPLYQPPPRRDSIGEETKAANAQKKKKQSLTSNDLKSRPVSSAKKKICIIIIIISLFLTCFRPGKRVQASRSTSTESDSIPQMPLVGNYTQTFSLDLPDNKSTMTTWNRTFIPMQLRTQPSNLPASQLQRVNSTLGEQAKGIQFKRVEALTRSQTLIDIKNTQNAALTLAEQVEKYPISHSATARDRNSGVMRGKGNNLMKSPSARHREPDSLLLQQSWSMGSHELQSAR